MESSSRPLADYFWIAGIEHIEYNDGRDFSSPGLAPGEPTTATTMIADIAEDGEEPIEEETDPVAAGAENQPPPPQGSNSSNNSNSNNSNKPLSRHSRQTSAHRLSKISTHTLEEIDPNTRSNRSSAATLKPLSSPTLSSLPPHPGGGSSSNNSNISSSNNNNGNSSSNNGNSNAHSTAPNVHVSSNGTVEPFAGLSLVDGPGALLGAPGMPDFDFDKALLKFAAERENFLEDLSFSAGAKVQARAPMVSPRPDRGSRAMDENSGPGAGAELRRNPLRSIKGSIRRKISFRDMTSVRKQPITPRPASVRTAKRLSHYNSVIPPPEPLNTDPDMHPLKRRFEPVLLDRYPPRDGPGGADELARRGRFPDYVPMFAFPNDIQIVSSDERPRSTWHGFTMTSEDSSKIYGITLIVWAPLPAEVADEVEKRCEEWRQAHMSNEERELAASLGVRLAGERTTLSWLLTRLGTVPSGTAARDALEDQISAVEEKITLMTEMLRPLRHGAASKIDGLTAGESGLWIPRAYGILGRDKTKMAFWKEWLRAVAVPMTDGAVLRVPASSPRVGRWQPLERYVINLCTEAFSPLGSMTQVELGVRELRLYARREAANELPGSRTGDMFALFRCLSLDNVVALFEYAMAESRIIFLSSHPAMLHLACHALAGLMYPLRWSSIFIPILPARLLSALEAPCPYIVGVERRYERIDLPEDDYVLVDLDRDTIDTAAPPGGRLPRQHRRKLMSLLQHAAPHRLRYGVAAGPPPYAVEAFPYDAFSTENGSIFSSTPEPSTLGRWVSQNSSTFSEPAGPEAASHRPVFNAFLSSKGATDCGSSGSGGGGSSSSSGATGAGSVGAAAANYRSDNNNYNNNRPGTGRSGKTSSSPSNSVSPQSIHFPTAPSTPVSMSDSGFALAATLREKRSGHFDDRSRRSSSFGMEKTPTAAAQQQQQQQYRPGLPFPGHQASMSVSAISIDSQSSLGGGGGVGGGPGGAPGFGAGYAPSMYAQSSLAASTIMPNLLMQPVRNTDTTVWVEGHRLEWCPNDLNSTCTVCDDRAEGDGVYKCTGCATVSHGRCLGVLALVCPSAFHEDRVRAAFVRCLASLLYTYRKYLVRPTKEQKVNGKLYSFDMEGFIKSLPYDSQEYAAMMRDTQAFNEFIHERETKPATDPSIKLFDEILMAKKARGRPGLGLSSGISRLSTIRGSHRASLHPPGAMLPPAVIGRAPKIPGYLSDRTDHIWRTASVAVPGGKFPGDYHEVVTRMPTRLDPVYMREPRAIQGVPPRPEPRGSARGLVRKRVPSMLGTTPPPEVLSMRMM